MLNHQTASTKIHALVDALGNPMDFILTPGQSHDLEGADALLPEMAAGIIVRGSSATRPLQIDRRRDLNPFGLPDDVPRLVLHWTDGLRRLVVPLGQSVA